MKRTANNGSEVDEIESERQSKKTKYNRDEFRSWGTDEVFQYFRENVSEDSARLLKEEDIVGSDLGGLTEEILQNKIGVKTYGQRTRLLREIAELSQTAAEDDTQDEGFIFGTPEAVKFSFDDLEYKVFNDPIHGHIDVHPLCTRIIDTPQFQRLRYLKQLGACYYVYPGASHNRFEHCIGVYHLAGELVRAIRSRQKELDITDVDILCVQIAGLCHDLGHGPFSHMFDGVFLPTICPDSKWQHEQGSVDMFDYLVEINNLRSVFEEHGLNDTDLIFIKEQIAGPLYRDKKNKQNWPYKGRDKVKSFLYEVVANKRNGIDVDKWDYFARDCRYLGINTNFDHTRFMKFARVISDGGEMQICNRDKEVNHVYDMFYTRQALHRRAYRHKTGTIIETMITEAMIKANDHILLPGKDGAMVRMSDCINDMEAFTRLTDNVYHVILYSTSKELAPAREILNKIERRDLYKCVGQTKPKDGVTFEKNADCSLEVEIAGALVDDYGMSVLSAGDLFVGVVNMDYGMKDENPIDYVRFYTKKHPDKAISFRKDQVSQMLPARFRDQYIRLYCRKTDPNTLSNATRCFKQWCEDTNMAEPKLGDLLTLEMTPLKAATSFTKQPSDPSKQASDIAIKLIL